MDLASIHVGSVVIHCSFPLQYGVPLCKYTTYFFTLLLKVIWVAFKSLIILNKTAMIVLAHVFWYMHFFLGMCLEVELL